MAVYFLDTSALVKLYVREEGTDRMVSLASGPLTATLAILSLARAEMYSAIRRRSRLGDIEHDDAKQALERFENHLRSRFLHQVVNDAVVDQACVLIDHHPLRAYDALQLAGCMVVSHALPEPPVFVCADRPLLEVAASEGLGVLNPQEDQPRDA